MPLNPGEQGSLRPSDLTGDFNAMRYLAVSLLSEMETATLVKVVSCSNSGGVSPVGTVQVQPLVNQLDGQNRPIAQPPLYDVPYFRLQGGSNAIIIDPEPGDIGVCVFASRDISTVKKAKAQASPGSNRKYDLGDALYIGGVLNGTPTQYIQTNSSGITIHSPTKVHVVAPDVTVDASTSATINTAAATVNATTSTQVVTGTASITAATSASVTAPSISLGASGQTLKAFLTSTFQILYNNHTHTKGGGTSTDVPDQQSPASDLTTTVTGG